MKCVVRSSMQIRTVRGMRTPSRRIFEWDKATMRYIYRHAQSELESLSDTIPDSPPLESVNSLHVPVAAVETVPIASPHTRPTLSGVVAAGNITPVVPAAKSSSPAGSPSAPVEIPQGGRGRSSKRPATKAPESSRNKKEARKTLKIQCSTRTKKGTRCRRHKEREDGDADWVCATHRGE